MKKDFNDFMKTINSKDWSLVVESIGKEIEGKDSQEAILLANLLATTTILKEYHEWVNK
ncbi:MAG: hypothetical protein KH415_23585 [Clostridium sp.]|nr:hypothetical protein [Clostridium sp.]